ncbi:MAG: SDR family oxidoreductase [Planctomycetaceae bacterium]|jgi:2-hydroxycyclohexanecarboxyl-CoA dehydrogenase|nr:SDR family oxidoreductase [Planctomycetaceae bacterium]MBT4011962.1 SDR family oxidoreductase [Planctomycetaceae bacterium]MBT4724176.1 SDR family oxidoreductase [Planctomycetaceae bacterium]MBT4845051.1 SDR family oxidoreductase [Planctomycetaceae bacterium]MBT5123679.1 SDR family oxidoreductase [Planctomycetaceae bacterium]
MTTDNSQASILIIGAAQGIGQAIARTFAADHYHVILADLSESVYDTVQQIRADLPQASLAALVLDATDLRAVEQLAENINEFLPDTQQNLQHVVYSAGAGSGKFGFPFWNMHPDDWKRVFDVNLMGAVNVAHAFSEVLRANLSVNSAKAVDSTLLFIASIAGQMGSQTDPPYSAAKAGLINFMQVVAKDLAPFGIRANAISPGMIQTSLNRSVWQAWNDQQAEHDKIDYEQWGQDKLKNICPLARWQTPAEIAATALFLASTGAANITGQTINVDGGIIMHS